MSTKSLTVSSISEYLYPEYCSGCLCKKVTFNPHTPDILLQLKQTNCERCRGWSIAPIPAYELGINKFPFVEFRHD